MMTALKDEFDLSDACAQVLQLPVKTKASTDGVDLNRREGFSTDQMNLACEYERFQLQVQLDIEKERELLYKSLLVIELLALFFVLRELMIRWLVGVG